MANEFKHVLYVDAFGPVDKLVWCVDVFAS